MCEFVPICLWFQILHLLIDTYAQLASVKCFDLITTRYCINLANTYLASLSIDYLASLSNDYLASLSIDYLASLSIDKLYSYYL